MRCLLYTSHAVVDATAFGILQAGRTRTSKTEYISCPGCGRTLYDLEKTIARIKAATSHLKGLKIGIMAVSYTHLDVYKRQAPILFVSSR